MEYQLCRTCGKETWHNVCGKDKKDLRCTYCAHPVGTGPKAEGHRAIHAIQLAKVNR